MLVRTRTMNKLIIVITIVLITDESVGKTEVERREVKLSEENLKGVMVHVNLTRLD